METKECKKCGYTVKIQYFEKDKRKASGRRDICSCCHKDRVKCFIYYNTPEEQEYSKKQNKIIEYLLKNIRKKEALRVTVKTCKDCNDTITERIMGQYLCNKCSVEKIKARKRERDNNITNNRYYKKRIRLQFKISGINIPQELIELKRNQLKLYRYGKDES